MPKKFRGENSKAVDARARKAAVTEAARAKKVAEAENAYWADDNKSLQKKQQRKTEREQKKAESFNKKKEREELYNAEMESLKSKKTAEDKSSRKITQAQISANAEREKAEKQDSEQDASKDPDSVPIEENINRVVRSLVAEDGIIEARSVEDAISALSVAGEVERHPERRVKAAYTKFEEDNLPRLKKENPNLRMSQLKQMLKKDWQKSPENPMNQRFLAYNVKA